MSSISAGLSTLQEMGACLNDSRLLGEVVDHLKLRDMNHESRPPGRVLSVEVH